MRHAAIEVQRGMAVQNDGVPLDKRIEFRVGIHVGDIIIDNNDIFGDGVNIAARLENIADPGGICMSDDAYRQIRGKVDTAFEDMGLQTLKNIIEPIRAWRMKIGSEASATGHFARAEPHQVRPLSGKPSIAVLPFQNMSGDPEQEYFVDGIAEDVLTTLSKIQELMVIARNSSFAFKGQNRDIREVGEIFGARYLLEGSVRKVGNRVRLTAQLIDSRDGGHLWADRFDGSLDDVFDLQDRITQEIVAALEVQLAVGERARVWRKRSGSPLAYEHVLKGRALYVNFARHTHAQARNQFDRALEINPAFMPALFLLGLTLTDQADSVGRKTKRQPIRPHWTAPIELSLPTPASAKHTWSLAMFALFNVAMTPWQQERNDRPHSKQLGRLSHGRHVPRLCRQFPKGGRV